MDTQGPTEPLHGISRGESSRSTQGCNNRLSYSQPIVAGRPRAVGVTSQIQAPNGKSPLRVQPHGATTDNSTSPIDRTGCPARADGKGQVRHGSRDAYRNYGCRCHDARESHRLYEKRRREGRLKPGYVDATGTSRRLQALAVAGYGCETLGDMLNPGASRIAQMRAMKYPVICAKRASEVAALFDRLQMTVAPDGIAALRTRMHATRHRWVPAMAWDDIDDPAETPQHQVEDDPNVIDEVELERLMLGELPAENSWRRGRLNRVAIRTFTQRGMIADDIARLLKISDRSVARIRTELGIAQTNESTVFEVNPGLARAKDRKPVGPHVYHGRHPHTGNTPPVSTPHEEAPAA